jgi:hypothetical protein
MFVSPSVACRKSAAARDIHKVTEPGGKASLKLLGLFYVHRKVYGAICRVFPTTARRKKNTVHPTVFPNTINLTEKRNVKF